MSVSSRSSSEDVKVPLLLRTKTGNKTKMDQSNNRQGSPGPSQRPSQNPENPENPDDNHHQTTDPEDLEELKYGAGHVIQIFVPVAICMLLVVISLKTLNVREGASATQFLERTSSGPDSVDVLLILRNVAIVLAVIIVMTTLVVLLYKYRCYAILYGWVILATAMILFFFFSLYLHRVLKVFNVPMDYVTAAFITLNWGVTGMVAIHWKSPLIVQQFFLIMNCVIISLQFIQILPEWTSWGLIGLIAVWDLVAVLTPCGPLRILVETAGSRGETLFPSLIYTAGVAYTVTPGMAQRKTDEQRPTQSNETAQQSLNENPNDVDNVEEINEAANESQQDSRNEPTSPEDQVEIQNGTEVAYRRDGPTSCVRRAPRARVDSETSRLSSQSASASAASDDEGHGVKLGLGDFIFYSLLVGKASLADDYPTVLACFLAILIGLGFTLLLLAVFKRALPALPISIFFGLIFYFSAWYCLSPFLLEMARSQIFV